jgi:hypothetical protein
VLHGLRIRIRLTLTVSAIFLSSLSAVGQSVEKGPVRTVLALGRVSSVVDTPMSFKLSRVSIPGGTSAVYRGAHSLVYVVSGAVTITVANDLRSVGPKQGAYLPTATDVTIHASEGAAAELLQYQLLRSADASKPAMNPPASATELHQMKIPADSLKPGPHEFSMTTVMIPAGASRPRPHTRSGAALYYVLADGTITIWPSANIDTLSGESRSESRRIGDIQEEPYGFIHSWSPKADVPLVLLQANISQEGVPEIIFVK